ncbi:MxaD family protein [Pacificimonas flava]|uniref:MxaD family protein n=2 Tax=Pacificimonas TaxID=1960290 RepID=A0A219B2F1_9SPHN|nr:MULTISPECIES: SRPBCC family protein [Pacificimonas]MBZ6378052.1 SRPBCC family protein [Pacificimonas aurantium]OWV32306.1 MxaD family protein [Pacificimonas flava]
MPKMKSHEPVGEEYLAAVSSSLITHRFPFAPDLVWNALLDAKAWTEWLPITNVTWTSPKPFGVGTTRTVEIDKQKVEEVFFAWEEGERMAFYFDKSTLPVKSAIEDYRVRRAPGGSELIWSGGASGFPLGWLVSKGLKKGIADGMPKLETLIANNPQRFRKS